MNHGDELKGGFMSQNRFNRILLSLVGLSACIFGYDVGRDLAIKQNEKDAAIQRQEKQQQIQPKNYPK
jgi:hypothetical protein